jgi:hypothetical protein
MAGPSQGHLNSPKIKFVSRRDGSVTAAPAFFPERLARFAL